MQVEIALPNPNGTLLPGALRAGRAAAGGEQRALRRADQRAALPRRRHARRRSSTASEPRAACSAVTLGRNLGESIEVLDGVGAGERLVVNHVTCARRGRHASPSSAADEPAAKRRARQRAPRRRETRAVSARTRVATLAFVALRAAAEA